MYKNQNNIKELDGQMTIHVTKKGAPSLFMNISLRSLQFS